MPAAKPKTSRHTEVERKFDVLDTTVSPSFEGLAAVTRVQHSPTQTLEAVYYDTAGYDLAARKITLRRRTGGTDAGWHIKLPSAVADTRTEVRAALQDSVPEEIRDVVAAIVRDRPLGAVARISTQRSVSLLFGAEGDPIAEFCDDSVTASALSADSEPQSWREWELELVGDGSPEVLERLANRLLDAGAAPAGHGSKLARVLDVAVPERAPASTDPVHRAITENVEALLEWDRAVRGDAWDSVHQMRVTTRKIRSLLAEESTTDNAWVLDELKQLAAVLGVARDAEVLAEKYDKALTALPQHLVRGPVRERLVEGAKQRYKAGWRRSVAALRSERYFRLLDALDAVVAAPPAGGAGGGSQVTVEGAYRKVAKAAKAAKVSGTDESLHRIRKRAKQLRYTAAAHGEAAVAESAKSIQTLLGDHQDSTVSRAHLLTQADAAHTAGEDTFTYGLLFQIEAEIALYAEEEIGDALRSLRKAMRK
ncbi:CYTH and CHAD domain-containing protein [Mycobacterium sp. BMJ-28]